MRKYFILPILATLIFSLLAGCANMRVQPSPIFQVLSPQIRQQSLSRITNWNIVGQMSVEDKTQAVIVNYQWVQKGRDYQIHLNAPLNLISAEVSGKQGGVVQLRRAKNQVYTAISPEVLLQQQLGWQIPISYLFSWIRGIPAPGKAKTKYDAYGHLVFLDQQNWHVSFAKYMTKGTVDLPQQIDLSYIGLHVRMIIKKWDLSK